MTLIDQVTVQEGEQAQSSAYTANRNGGVIPTRDSFPFLVCSSRTKKDRKLEFDVGSFDLPLLF